MRQILNLTQFVDFFIKSTASNQIYHINTYTFQYHIQTTIHMHHQILMHMHQTSSPYAFQYHIYHQHKNVIRQHNMSPNTTKSHKYIQIAHIKVLSQKSYQYK